MKTSHILLAIIAAVTLTGMIATDVLLKQQYEKIDWRNPYQNFQQRSLPKANHWIVEGTSISEILIEHGMGAPQLLIDPEQAKFLHTHQRGDTAFVTFTPEFSGYRNQPRDDANQILRVQLLVRVPNVQTLRIKNARLTLGELTMDKLQIMLQNSRLRTNKLKVSDSFSVLARQNSFVVLGPEDQYKSLQTVVQDSSGIQLNNTQTDTLIKDVSPKAEVQLRRQALKWLK